MCRVEYVVNIPIIKSYQRARHNQYGVHNTTDYIEYRKLLQRKIRDNGVYGGEYNSVDIQAVFNFHIPKSCPSASGGILPSKREHVQPHNIVKDVDNLIKAVMDAGNGLLFRDDMEVVSVSSSKRYKVNADQYDTIELIITYM